MVAPILYFIFENNMPPKNKLAQLLQDLGMTQTEFYYLIIHKTGKTIGMDRISKMVSGKLTNYSIDTAKTIAKALEVGIEEIVD